MQVDVIIVTYNGMKWIDSCLKSVLNSSISVRPVVIDNCSTDGTVDYVKLNFPEVILLEQNKNLGFGAASNIGMSLALKEESDFVLLLNQDAYIKVDTIESLIKVHHYNKEYGILSPIHLNGNGSKLDRNFSSYICYDNNPSFLSDYVIGTKKQTIYDVPFVNAAAWLLPKNTLLTVGGFDPLFFHYGEDDHYCQRTLFHNLKIGIVPEAFVLHDRENRKEKPVVKFSDSYVNLRLKQYKHKFANVNNSNWEKELKKELNFLKKTQIKQMLIFKWKTAKGFKKLYKVLIEHVDEIRISRILVVQKGNHYLTLNKI